MNGLLISALATCAALTGALPAWLTTDRIVVLCIPLATCAAIVAMSALDKAAAFRLRAAALSSALMATIAAHVARGMQSTTIRSVVSQAGSAPVSAAHVARAEMSRPFMLSTRRLWAGGQAFWGRSVGWRR